MYELSVNSDYIIMEKKTQQQQRNRSNKKHRRLLVKERKYEKKTAPKRSLIHKVYTDRVILPLTSSKRQWWYDYIIQQPKWPHCHQSDLLQLSHPHTNLSPQAFCALCQKTGKRRNPSPEQGKCFISERQTHSPSPYQQKNTTAHDSASLTGNDADT